MSFKDNDAERIRRDITTTVQSLKVLLKDVAARMSIPSRGIAPGYLKVRNTILEFTLWLSVSVMLLSSLTVYFVLLGERYVKPAPMTRNMVIFGSIALTALGASMFSTGFDALER